MCLPHTLLGPSTCAPSEGPPRLHPLPQATLCELLPLHPAIAHLFPISLADLGSYMEHEEQQRATARLHRALLVAPAAVDTCMTSPIPATACPMGDAPAPLPLVSKEPNTCAAVTLLTWLPHATPAGTPWYRLMQWQFLAALSAASAALVLASCFFIFRQRAGCRQPALRASGTPAAAAEECLPDKEQAWTEMTTPCMPSRAISHLPQTKMTTQKGEGLRGGEYPTLP